MKKSDPTMEQLRGVIKLKGYPMYLIAEMVGVHPSTLCVWFRTYNADHYKKISDAMQKIERGDQDDEDNQTGK